MSKTILLDTRTANFMELIGNGKIYRVPPYQRDYSWREEHWEDLWNDIIEMHGQTAARHYMGALVIEGLNDREFQIIDGQQRLATLSLLALAVISRLKDLIDSGIDPENNSERARGLRQRFVGEKDPASLQESSKLFLNETDDPFYQDYLVQLREPINPRGLPKSNKLLWGCLGYFKKRLADVAVLQKDGAALAALLNETIARQLMFILISVDDELNAYTVFETLNARGLELSSTDLLKNYLFSCVKVKADLEALQRRWRQLIATVQQERFPEFLRYHLLCKYRKVRSQRLFKMIRESVREPTAVFSLLEALEQRAELFSALSDPYHEYWIERRPCQPHIKELQLFNVRQMTPLLFAAWETFDDAQFARILRTVSVISFRYTVVSGLNTNELEPIYHDAARAILDGRASNPAQVFQYLQPVYVGDEQFEQRFALLEAGTSRGRKKLAKYILANLESDRSDHHFDPETDPATIEHILPENPCMEWADGYPEDRWPDDIYRLGNLTLLEASANRRVGNSKYSEKLIAYSESIYPLTRDIAELAPEEWTHALLETRQRQMARRAAHVWRLDF